MAIQDAYSEFRAAEDFIIREADLLDDRMFEEWEALFDEDGYYWAPARPDQPNPHDELSIFFDDKELMKTRFARLRHPRVHIDDPPHRTLRLLGSVRIASDAPPGVDLVVLSKQFLATYRLGRQQVYAARVEHAIRKKSGDFKIAWKKVTLINCDDVFDPLTVPV